MLLKIDPKIMLGLPSLTFYSIILNLLPEEPNDCIYHLIRHMSPRQEKLAVKLKPQPKKGLRFHKLVTWARAFELFCADKVTFTALAALGNQLEMASLFLQKRAATSTMSDRANQY